MRDENRTKTVSRNARKARRTWAVFLTALSAAHAAVLGSAQAGEPAAANVSAVVRAPAYDWGVAYYLSYDNDLDRAGRLVLQKVREGLTAGRQVAALQADYTDTLGMRRYVVTPQGVTETKVDSEDSASEAQAAGFLEWFAATYPCRHYAFVFLDHGGKLDQMCLDERPDTPGKEWMSGRVLGGKLRALRPKLPGRWDLLFFQQCGRGSLENLYSFRETAEFLLCSPAKVGAPNSYYASLHRLLGADPERSGERLAAEIAKTDTDYLAYLCLRGARLGELPARLTAALKPLLEKKDLVAAPLPTAVYTDQGEATCDAAIYLQRLAERNGAGAAEVQALEKWLREELAAGLWLTPAHRELVSRVCKGPTLFVPASVEEARRYAFMDLYAGSSLPELWRKLGPKEETGK